MGTPKIFRQDGTEITRENWTPQDLRDKIESDEASIQLFQGCADMLRDSAAVFAKRAAEAGTDEEREKWSKKRNDAERQASEAQAQANAARSSQAYGRSILPGLEASQEWLAEMRAETKMP